jgi:hypothetical protein
LGTTTINKNSSATVLTIKNFNAMRISGLRPVDILNPMEATESEATIINFNGPSMTIDLEYIITDESSNVVSGTGSPVTAGVD